MKEVFSKTGFPAPPGGNIYHWRAADTLLDIARNGQYIVEITASAKNAAQNRSTDDDDLRVVIDSYAFGKQEIHQEKVSWKGFGVASAWDGASLQGGSKTIYFFVPFTAGEHLIEFWADETPTIQSVRVLQIEQLESEIEDPLFALQERAPGSPADSRGIPWKSFIFAPGSGMVKLVDITAIAQSAKQKGGTDGDNIKVYVNGRIVHNPKAPTSDKYKNFFFSGDLSQGKTEALMIRGQDFLLSDQDTSLELWYDETPVLKSVKFELQMITAYDQERTLKRRLVRAVEALQVPFNVLIQWSKILDTVDAANDAARRFAEQNGFSEEGPNGVLRLLIEDNEPDALRHFSWNVLLTRAFSAEIAGLITTNHEVFWMTLHNKQDLSRSNVQDMWNNAQGRNYAAQYPDIDILELFELAKADGKIILTLEDVTPERIQEVHSIIDHFQP